MYSTIGTGYHFLSLIHFISFILLLFLSLFFFCFSRSLLFSLFYFWIFFFNLISLSLLQREINESKTKLAEKSKENVSQSHSLKPFYTMKSFSTSLTHLLSLSLSIDSIIKWSDSFETCIGRIESGEIKRMFLIAEGDWWIED